MPQLTNKCEYCGDMFQNYGFATHVRYCKKASSEAREAGRIRRNKYFRQQVTPAMVNTHEPRIRLCISVSVEQLKQLLPFLEIDEVKIV